MGLFGSLFSSKSSSSVNKEYITNTSSTVGDVGFTGKAAVDFMNVIQAGNVASQKITADVMKSAGAGIGKTGDIVANLGKNIRDMATGSKPVDWQSLIVPGVALLGLIFVMKGGK